MATAGALCSASCPSSLRCRQGRRQSTIHTAQNTLAAPQQRAGRLQASRGAALWGGGDGGAPPPLKAALLSAVQLLAALQLALPAAANGGDFTIRSEPPAGDTEEQYFETVPQGLASSDSSTAPRLGALIEGPKGKQVQQCTRKCVPTCIRGGQGAPGLGPMSVRRESAGVVFKEGYRSRSYCLSECTQVCALSLNPAAPKAEAGK